MFPIKDLMPSGKFPFVTWLLILANVAVFLYMRYEAPSPLYLVDFGLVPAKLGLPSAIMPFYAKVYPFFTYMFVHGGWFHLIFNVYFLYVFGDRVECRMGHGRYLFFYLMCGIAAAIVYVFFSPVTGTPIVGASGAVAGVMGAYMVFFPSSRIRTLLIIVIFITVANVPAVVFIGIWFIVQIIGAALGSSSDGGIAWWAHLGGFAAGAAVALAVRLAAAAKRCYKTA